MSPVDVKKYGMLAELVEEVLYAQLTSTEKSEEYASGFLEINRGDKLKNYARLRKYCSYYGEFIKQEMIRREGTDLTSEDKDKIEEDAKRNAKIKLLKEENGQ